MMKKYLSALSILLPALLLIYASQAHATDFFVTVEGGRASTDFNPQFTPDGTTESANSTAYSAGIGLKFESQIVLGAGFSGAISDNVFSVFDSYDFSQEQLYLGYRFKINNHFRITPQVGMTHWTLTSEESSITRDDHAKKNEHSGNDVYSQINLEFPVSKLVTIVGSYSRTNYDFGSTSSVQAGVIFEFD